MVTGAAIASAGSSAATSNAYSSGYAAGSTNTYAASSNAYNAGVAAGSASTASAYNAGVAAGSAGTTAAGSSASSSTSPLSPPASGNFVMGAIYATLPAGCITPNVQGKTYYLCGNTWFKPSYGANGVYYTVVPTP